MRILLLIFAVLLANVSSAWATATQDVKLLLETHDSKALTSAEVLVKSEAKNPEAWILLARAQLQANKNEAAIGSAEKATKLAPGNAQAYFWLGNAYGSRIGQVGMFSKMSMASKLRDAFEMTVNLDPNNLDAREALLQFYLQAPGIVGGGKDKASIEAAEIAKRDPARGYLAQAQIYVAEENYSGALKSYQAAYAAKPSDPNIRLALGVGYQQLKQWQEAFTFFRAWVAQDPKAGLAWYQIGRTSALSGLQLEEGIAALHKYLTMPHGGNEPQNKNAYFRLGQVLAMAGKKAEAKSAYQAALKLDPKYTEASAALTKL